MTVSIRTVGAPALRYERKFVVPWSARHGVLAKLRLHPARFEEQYAPRFVNSLYFDTPSFRHYWESVDGVARREKTRIRWYGDLCGHVDSPHVEAKAKDGNVGWKRTSPLPDFELKPGVTGEELDAWLGPPRSREVSAHALGPVLMNRYRRAYWVSRDGRFRVTMDSNVAYHRVSRMRNAFLRPLDDPWSVIIELKYDVSDDADASGITRGLPFRLGRNSKYVIGVDRLYGHLGCVLAE